MILRRANNLITDSGGSGHSPREEIRSELESLDRRHHSMHRRAALKQLCALSASVGLGASFARQRNVFASGAPPTALSPILPEALRAQNVLEIFLCGGLSQYESVYCVLEHGRTNGTHFHLYGNSPELASQFEACGFSGPLTEPFAQDALGQLVHFGPFVMPLRQRLDVMERVRVGIVRHDLAPHEAAIPLALAGRPLGNAALAGLGSHIQRFFLDRDGESSGPLSYALLSGSLGALAIDNLRTVVATGLHPASARPLSIKVDAAGNFDALLERRGVGASRAQYDELLDVYVDQYRRKLRWKGQGEALRGRRFSDLAAGARSLADVDVIRSVLDPAHLASVSGVSCGQTAGVDAVGMQLRLAAHLLTHSSRPARYVCVVDGGLFPLSNGGGGYDSHADNTVVQARNLSHTMRTLMSLIRAPGEDAPEKLDLDRTLIVLTTEFGRSPSAEGGTGRNHWPYGYPVVLIGGPIRSRGVSGAVGSDGFAVRSATPQESRIATLLSLGIWPFGAEGFNVADVPGAVSEEDAAVTVLREQLGIT